MVRCQSFLFRTMRKHRSFLVKSGFDTLQQILPRNSTMGKYAVPSLNSG